MEAYKNEIIRQLDGLNNGGHYGPFSDLLRKIDEALCWAWRNWDDDIIATYYEFEKPERPNEKFITNWVENEDFEADGYDKEELEETFG
ncbi:hypothetical protein [Niabella aurantiaca]|uniref:hypothetical protein n=1 Tax=Niabella aurantiaca TaxID=379900 RepID=UPI00035F348C|nr:hypothetical protein [Niabella aurantiaca]